MNIQIYLYWGNGTNTNTNNIQGPFHLNIPIFQYLCSSLGCDGVCQLVIEWIKNPLYGIHWISQLMPILAPIFLFPLASKKSPLINKVDIKILLSPSLSWFWLPFWFVKSHLIKIFLLSLYTLVAYLAKTLTTQIVNIQYTATTNIHANCATIRKVANVHVRCAPTIGCACK